MILIFEFIGNIAKNLIFFLQDFDINLNIFLQILS